MLVFWALILQCLKQGKKKPEEWAKEVWAAISAQGQRLTKEGKTLESEQDNLKEITRQAEAFAKKKLPILRALGVA